MWGTQSGDFRKWCGQIRLLGSESSESSGIPSPSLRTRRCVAVGILICAWNKAPWQSNLSTWSFEYHLASRRYRTVHRWRTCSNRTGQVHHHWPGFRHNPVPLVIVLPSFSPSFRWCSKASWNSWRSRKSWNGWCWTSKEDNSIRHVWSVLLSISLRSGAWCQCAWFEFWDPNWFCQTTNQEKLCGIFDTSLIVGLLPLIITLITASLSSNTYNIAMDWEILTFEGILSIWNNSELSWLVGALVWFFFRVLDMTRCHGFPCADESFVLLGWFWLQWIISITKFQRSKAVIPSIRRPASREIIKASVELWETEVCLLHIQLIGATVRLPKKHKIPPDVHFESSKSPAKSESWDSSILHCCAVFPAWQLMFEFTCVMNVRNQTC